MSNIKSAINFINIFDLRAEKEQLNQSENISVFNSRDEIVGQIQRYRNTIIISVLTTYGNLMAEYIIDEKGNNNQIEKINYDFKSKNISGTYTFEYKNNKINKSCQMNKKYGNSIIIDFNTNDLYFDFSIRHKKGAEDFLLSKEGKIVYSSAAGAYDYMVKSFPFFTTITINRMLSFERILKAHILITDRNVPIYNKTKTFSYNDALIDSLDALDATNADIFGRIEYLRSVIGDDLFTRIASSCLEELSKEEFYKLFSVDSMNINYQMQKPKENNDKPVSFRLYRKTNKKSSL